MNLKNDLRNGAEIKITTSVYPLALLTDIVLRYATVYLLYKNIIGTGTFLLFQYFIITIILVVILVYKDDAITKYYKEKINQNVKIETNQSGQTFWIVLALVLLIGTGTIWYTTKLIGIQSLIFKVLYTGVNVCSYFFIIALALVTAQTKKVKSAEYAKGKDQIDLRELQLVAGVKISSKSHITPVNVKDIDSNDIQITTTLSEYNQINARSDTYVIESVFIGALAFSGFLTIVTSDKIEENVFELQGILRFIWDLIKSIDIYDSQNILVKGDELYENYRLYSVLAVECLVCSSFFILVLAARIHFAKLADQAKYLIDLAVTFNNKEEEINNISYQLGPVQQEKLKLRSSYLAEKIDEVLLDLSAIMPKIRPLFTYMTVFRNLGLYSFYLILITSGLFFSPQFAFALVCLILIGYLIKFGMRVASSRLLNQATGRYLSFIKR